MKKRIVLFVVIILIVSLCCVLSASAYTSQQPSTSTPWNGEVSTSGSHLLIRICPTNNCDVVYSLENKSKIQIIGRVSAADGDWYRVEYDLAGSTGYVKAEYITSLNKTYGIVTAPSGLNMRDSASESGSIQALAPYGKSLSFIEKTVDDWYHVVWGVTEGFVSGTYFSTGS